jgi:ABC-type Fe3+-siderophore transport system permease subunit
MEARPREQARNLYDNRKKALVWMLLGVVGGYALGVPTSFIRRRGSLPWEPFDMVIIGTIWAAVFTVFTVLVLYLMHRYVKLYETGTRVASAVTGEQMRPGGRGVTVKFTDAAGNVQFSWLFPSQLPVGAQTSTIVGPAGTRLVLNHDGQRYVRGSALTPEQLGQVIAGPAA